MHLHLNSAEWSTVGLTMDLKLHGLTRITQANVALGRIHFGLEAMCAPRNEVTLTLMFSVHFTWLAALVTWLFDLINIKKS